MDDFEWTAYHESKLFEAMLGYRPVGVNRYFEMACIVEKLQDVDIPSDRIWSHLETMYNLELLDETEGLRFPNDEREFYLPELEFGAMKVKKEEKPEDKNGKSTTKRNENKDTTKTPNTKEVKKEEKTIGKKDNQRRDSKDGKELKLSITLKKEVKKEVTEKPKPMKSRSSMNMKEEEKSRTPSRTDEALKRTNKRPTRGSTKPDDPGTPLARKSQSPLTITSASATKRRRL